MLPIWYLEIYIRSLEHWLSYWIIAIKPLEHHNDFLIEDYVGEQKTPPVQVFAEQVPWVYTAQCLGVTRATKFVWSKHINQVGRGVAQRMVLVSDRDKWLVHQK